MTLRQCLKIAGRSVLYTWLVSLLVFAVLGSIAHQYDPRIIHNSHSIDLYLFMVFLGFLMGAMYSLVPMVFLLVVRFLLCAGNQLGAKSLIIEFHIVIAISLLISHGAGGWKEVEDLFPEGVIFLLAYGMGQWAAIRTLPKAPSSQPSSNG